MRNKSVSVANNYFDKVMSLLHSIPNVEIVGKTNNKIVLSNEQLQILRDAHATPDNLCISREESLLNFRKRNAV